MYVNACFALSLDSYTLTISVSCTVALAGSVTLRARLCYAQG